MHIETVDERIQVFLERVFRISKSYSTRRSYQVAVHKFEDFLRIRYNLDINEAIRQFETKGIDALEALNEFYTYLSQCNLSNGTIRGYIVIAQGFLNSQNLHIYNEDVKQRFRLPKKESVYEEGLTNEILVRLLHNSSPKLQTAILVCASSGMRIGELVQLKISDIDFTTTPTTIYLRKEITKTRETRFTHITGEATNSLKDYLRRTFRWIEGSNENKYIFLNCNDPSDNKLYHKAVMSAKVVLMTMVLRVVKSVPELSKKNENGRNNIHFHALRAWFKTQVTNAHQSDFAEALMGHKSIKLTYFRQNAKDRLKTYLEVEPSLTISDFTKVEATMEDLKTELASMKLELEKQKQRLEIAEKYAKKS